ncbi:polysaccharide deacetylase family protein [Lipingzhangella sp. LS1_29]|uniref:Polysaccharide deacetylase family protein n=1 Tax=Lipingzhangella rawalii TaxID=2055835 RepID=A0ABU2HB25_9ACTN|nr:polysaccharide deacetylase family protein [Lipingzhangella rawalii]MDS1272517.1 polysaccharide deacetylase family protein [Lipingzhangella rawalii]
MTSSTSPFTAQPSTNTTSMWLRALALLVAAILTAVTPAATDLATTQVPDTAGADGNEEPTVGDPEHLTVVDSERMLGLEEHTESTDEDGLEVDIAIPEIPGAAPLNRRLHDDTTRAVEDFELAHPGAEHITTNWEITAAAQDVVGVRLITEETGVRMTMEETGSTSPGDDPEPRASYTTLWYDAAAGHVAESTELLSDQEAFEELVDTVSERLADVDEIDVNPDHVVPVAQLFRSMGFNVDGDLVVEFAAGAVAPPEEGRVYSIVEREQVEPLLSEFGERALEAAATVEEEFEVSEDDPVSLASDPGDIPGHYPQPTTSVDCDDDETRCVALTFDDGPGDGTPELLDTLDEYDARATFFVTGGPAREHIPTIRRQYAEGHEVANHTMNHPDLTDLSTSEIRAETEPLQAMLRRAIGHSPDLVRPPYGATNDDVAEVMQDTGMAEIMWSVDTLDWDDRDSDVVAERAIEGATEGAIILFHDIHPTTVQAIPEVLAELDEDGYTFVTVTELLGATEPGQDYWDGTGEYEGF